MNLVIVESATKIKSVEKYLGKDYKVMASVGHVIDLPPKELGVDIENDFKPTYTTMEGKERVIAGLKKEAKNADVIYLATDPDREGEAIAWHIAETVSTKRNPKPLKRVLFNEITKSGVMAGIENPTDINMNRVNAQQSRRILDRLVGYLVSPLLWRPLKYGLSAGRVQSVALRLVCEREQEIETFVPVESWTIDGKFDIKGSSEKTSGVLGAKLDKISGKKANIKNEAEVNAIIADIPKDSKISSVETKEVKQSSAEPFKTSQMQQDAINKLGFTSKKVMTVAQKLYEGVELADGPTGLITYMRTDSTRVSPEAVAECEKFITNNFGSEYLPKTKKVGKKAGKNIQDAHEAIRPTSVMRTPASVKKYLDNDQYKLYKLIWERFVASQMADAIYDQTTVLIDADKYQFRTSARVIKFAGFTKLYMESRDVDAEDDENDDTISFGVEEGSASTLQSTSKKQHFTKAPPRFTEASLVKILEKEGIGRPSTYASIISTIVDREYVELKKDKRFHPTELGRIVNNMLVTNFPKIFEVKFTAGMENELDLIEEGTENWTDVLKEFYKNFEVELNKAKEGKLASTLATNMTCPTCNKGDLTIKYGKSGPFVACSEYPECAFTSGFERDDKGGIKLVDDRAMQSIGVACEKCGKDLVLKNTRFGEMIACSGYPECKNIKNFMRTAEGEIKIIENGTKVEGDCPKCGGEMVVKSGRNGLFAACSNFPTCRSTLPVKADENGKLVLGEKEAEPTSNEACEKCGKPMAVKRGPRGPFLACTGYPDCKNAKSMKK